MKIWVTSDTHFDHFNIIKYCNRPFPTVDLMNSALIRNWNNSIAEDDIVIFCGDFCFARTSEAAQVTERFARALHGHKIIVKGNHDFQKFRYCDVGFDAEFYQEWNFGRFLFCHRPDNLPAWHKEYDFVFYGHVHDKTPEVTFINTINVCLDANNLQPLDISDYFTSDEAKRLRKLINLDQERTKERKAKAKEIDAWWFNPISECIYVAEADRYAASKELNERRTDQFFFFIAMIKNFLYNYIQIGEMKNGL